MLVLMPHRPPPLATDSSMSKSDALLNKRLHPLPVGWPRKKNLAMRRFAGQVMPEVTEKKWLRKDDGFTH